MYFHDYDTSYDPALPVIEFSISGARGQAAITLLALIDSGADATAIPVRYLEQIGALPVESRWWRSATGERHRVQLYQVYLQFGNYGQYLSVVGDTFSEDATIGRDILNYYVVKLDGPASVVEISS